MGASAQGSSPGERWRSRRARTRAPSTDPVDALVFADDSTMLYGIRIVRDGTNDRAEVLSIDFASGATEILNTITYPHPEIIADPALKEAQFADNGGIVRMYVTVDGYVVAWILGAPADLPHRPGQRRLHPGGEAADPLVAGPAPARQRQRGIRSHDPDPGGPGRHPAGIGQDHRARLAHPLGGLEQRDRLHPRPPGGRRRAAGPVRLGPGGRQGPGPAHQQRRLVRCRMAGRHPDLGA